MPLEDILPRLKTINSGVSGITSAFDHDDLPENIHTADLPAVFVYPQIAPIDYSAAQQAHVAHQIVIDIYVSPRSRAPLQQQLNTTVPFVDLFITEYADAMRLNDLDQATAETDDYIAQLTQYEVAQLEYADVFYVGIRFLLVVHEHICKTVGT